MYRQLALFTDKHVVRIDHKYALIFLKAMVNEQRIEVVSLDSNFSAW